MMYYEGEPVKILGNAGDVTVPGLSIKLVLLKCESLEEPGKILWIFREYMRAQGGWIEIQKAAEKAPKITDLPEKELAASISAARS